MCFAQLTCQWQVQWQEGVWCGCTRVVLCWLHRVVKMDQRWWGGLCLEAVQLTTVQMAEQPATVQVADGWPAAAAAAAVDAKEGLHLNQQALLC